MLILRFSWRSVLCVFLLAVLAIYPETARAQAQQDEWNKLSPEQREALRRQYLLFKQLPPGEQQEITQRLSQLRRLGPEEKALIRENYQAFQKMDPEQRKALQQNYERWKTLPPQRQEQLRQNYRRLLKMPPEQRKKFLDNYQQWMQKTPEERAQIRAQRQLRANSKNGRPPAPPKQQQKHKPQE